MLLTLIISLFFRAPDMLLFCFIVHAIFLIISFLSYIHVFHAYDIYYFADDAIILYRCRHAAMPFDIIYAMLPLRHAHETMNTLFHQMFFRISAAYAMMLAITTILYAAILLSLFSIFMLRCRL